MRRQLTKRNVLLLALLLVLAAGAYAYFSSQGSGTGEATVGSPSEIELSSPTVGDLYPGGADVPVTVTIHNPGSGDQHVGEISGVVIDNGACLGEWFEVDSIPYDKTLAPDASDTADSDVRMLDPGFSGPVGSGASSGVDQDECQGKTMTINWSTGESGSGESASSGGTGVQVASPANGVVTIDFGSAAPAPDGETNVTPAITVTAPAAGAGQSNTVTIAIDAGDLPEGTTLADINVYADGNLVPDCTTTAPASPSPCVSSVVNGLADSIVVTINDNGGSSTTYTVTSSAGGGCNGDLSGDVPNNAGGAPANDDFCYARVLNGDSGFYNGTMASATVQQNGVTWREMAGGNNDYQNFSQNFYGDDVTHSVWFTWTAPASGQVAFSTEGSPDYDKYPCDPYFDYSDYSVWSNTPSAFRNYRTNDDYHPPVLGAFDATDWDVIGSDLYNSWSHVKGGPVTQNMSAGDCGDNSWHYWTKMSFNATAGTQYVIWLYPSSYWDIGGQYKLSWSMP